MGGRRLEDSLPLRVGHRSVGPGHLYQGKQRDEGRVAGLEPDLDEVAAVAPTLAWSFLPFSLASLLWLLDAPLSSLVRLGSWSALTRRAGAYWASPDDVKGPEDVFARLLDEGPALRLDDVEGFVTYADAEQWPMRWRVLRGWVRAAQNRVDAAVRAGDEQLVLAGRSLPTLEAADRLDRVAKRLWPRHRLRTSVL